MTGSMMQTMKVLVVGLALIGVPAIGLAAKLVPGQDPANFYPEEAWLRHGAMTGILEVGDVWCMEPQGGTCGFMSIVTGVDGSDYTYDVIEKWDENTVLSVTTIGALWEDGRLCETVTGTFDDITVTATGGKDVKSKRVEDIRAELQQIWSDYVGTVYCYTYAVTDPRQPDLITQYMYQDGTYLENPIVFIVDKSANALDRYTLRNR